MTSVCSNTIDWVATGAMLQGIGTLAGVLAVVLGAVIGANAWRKQKRAERLAEMAEKILTSAYKGRRALKYIRSPLIHGFEINAAEEKLKSEDWWEHQPEKRKKRLVTGQSYFNRINNTKDQQNLLEECLPMARALFGESMEKSIDDLRNQFWMVQIDVESYIEDNGEDKEFTKKVRRGITDSKPRDGERNETSDAIESAISSIESACLPALKLETAKNKVLLAR